MKKKIGCHSLVTNLYSNYIYHTFRIYNLYSFQIIPVIGQIIAADKDSYQYLVESIRRFPSQEQFAGMIKNSGFTIVGDGWEDLTFGVVALHSGFKL